MSAPVRRGTFKRIQRVLVVEPFADLADLVAELLRRAGLEPVCVATGEAALQAAEAGHVDLLVTELRLKGPMTGTVLLDRWRALGHHSPVIFIADDTKLIPREKLALDDCCASIIQKPMSFDQFFTALQAADARVHHEQCVHRKTGPISTS